MTASAAEKLRARWPQLWLRLDVPATHVPSVEPLLQAYQSPERAYHNLSHVAQCLAELESIRLCAKPDEIELALWFHDVVYDARRHDNEERSAEQAADAIRSAEIDSNIADNVVALILVTKHSSPPAAGDEQIIVDIDLSILGRPQAEFDAYEQAIRREYSFVDEASFRAGRLAILKTFLARDFIFNTELMRQKYEAAARANLQRSSERLTRWQ